MLIAQILEPEIKYRCSRAEKKFNNRGGGGRERAPLKGTPPKLNQMDMIRTGPDNAPILMLRSAQHIIIPGRTARSVSVQVPVNPAHYLHVYPIDDEAIHGATGWSLQIQDTTM